MGKKFVNALLIAAMAIALILGLVIHGNSEQMEKNMRKAAIASELLWNSAERRYLTMDFALNPSERAKEQWRNRHGRITELLESGEFMLPEEKYIIGKMRRDNEGIAGSFSKLVQASEKEMAGGDTNAGARKKIFLAQVLVKSQTMVVGSSRLSEMALAEVNNARQRVSEQVTWLLAAMALLIGVSAIFSKRAKNKH